jgi:hypothetical protein
MDHETSVVGLGRTGRRSLRLTLEALVDVDSGRFIDQQALQAWADSLEQDEPLPVPY